MNDNEIIICSNCYEENRYGENYCHNCGKRLYYNLDNVDEEQTNVVKEDDIGKEIKLGIAEFDTMNPLLSKNKQVQEITKIIYEPLFQLTSDYKLEKCLAKAQEEQRQYIAIHQSDEPTADEETE